MQEFCGIKTTEYSRKNIIKPMLAERLIQQTVPDKPNSRNQNLRYLLKIKVLYTTGISVTAGIGNNLYLAKVAMDIVAKHVPVDKDGVRIAELNEC